MPRSGKLLKSGSNDIVIRILDQKCERIDELDALLSNVNTWMDGQTASECVGKKSLIIPHQEFVIVRSAQVRELGDHSTPNSTILQQGSLPIRRLSKAPSRRFKSLMISALRVCLTAFLFLHNYLSCSQLVFAIEVGL